MEKGKFLMEVDHEMIIYTDIKCYPFIYKMRDDLGFIDKTKIVVKKLSDFELYKYRETIVKNRENDDLYKNTRNTANYFILVSSKFEMLKTSVELNYFNSTHFIWIDFGILNSRHTKQGMIEQAISNIDDTFRCCYIHYRNINEMKNYTIWHRYFRCGISGQILGAYKDTVVKIYELFKDKFIDLVQKGYGRAEEQILTEIESENSQLFNVYPGDYYSALANYVNITEDLDCILNNFISNAREGGNNLHSYNACKSIERSLDFGLIKLNNAQLMKYYTEYFISAWYVDNQKTINIVRKLRNEMNNNDELCKIFLSNINYYTSTFDFIRSILPVSKSQCIKIFLLKK